MGRVASNRGFTLVEMLTAAAIIGLILLLIGYEFDAIIAHSLHTRSNRDLETNARFAVNKVTNRLRTASPWVIASPTPAPPWIPEQVLVAPIPTGTPGATGTTLQFYRVHQGSLVNPAAIPSPGNVPYPPYDIVTIQRSNCPTPPVPASPNCLTETAVDAQTGAPSETPLVLANDVISFNITATGDVKSAKVDISLTVNTPDLKCGPRCTYTTSSSVWVGGVQVNE